MLDLIFEELLVHAFRLHDVVMYLLLLLLHVELNLRRLALGSWLPVLHHGAFLTHLLVEGELSLRSWRQGLAWRVERDPCEAWVSLHHGHHAGLLLGAEATRGSLASHHGLLIT